MSDTVEYEARTMSLYELDGGLFLSMSTTGGEHVKIKIGPRQAAMVNMDTSSYLAHEFVKMDGSD